MKRKLVKFLNYISVLTICLVLCIGFTTKAEDVSQETMTTVQDNLCNLILEEGYSYNVTIEPSRTRGAYRETITHMITHTSGNLVFKLVQVTDWDLVSGSYVSFIKADDTSYTTSPFTSIIGGADAQGITNAVKYKRLCTVYDSTGNVICKGYFYTICTVFGNSYGGIESY